MAKSHSSDNHNTVYFVILIVAVHHNNSIVNLLGSATESYILDILNIIKDIHIPNAIGWP